jgi:hypothetical protein
VQINVGHLDSDGIFNGAFTTYAFSGAVRQRVGALGGAPAGMGVPVGMARAPCGSGWVLLGGRRRGWDARGDGKGALRQRVGALGGGNGRAPCGSG